MSPIKLGSSLKKPSACVTPTPRQMEVAAMSVLRWSMPASCIMRTPDIIIEPNMMTVQPPSTQSGSVVKNAPMGGNRPPRIIAGAPNMIVKRLTTWVIEMRPTFWLNDVMGEQPNTPPESAEASVMVATRRFCHEPSGYADEEPNDETPTFRMLRPIETTTQAETMGEMILRQYLAVRPSTPSKQPPT